MNMQNDTKRKKCDGCGLFLRFSEFYKNKAKNDGMQNKCKDCIKDYKVKLQEGITVATIIKRTSYFIPDIYLVGYGRMQTFQHSCLACEAPFFCCINIKDGSDLFCDSCQHSDMPIPEKNIGTVNYIGNVIGWLAKLESPSKKRNHRNYKNAYHRDKYTCQYCGYNLQDAKEFLPLHIDHIKPWSAAGGNALNNLVVSCQTCNLIASDKWFSSFEEKKEHILFERQRKKWHEEKANN